jgi:hypothetical protein
MRVIRSSGSVRGGAGNVPAYSAEGQLDLACFGEGTVSGIAVDLQDPTEALKMGHGTLGLAIGRVDISDGRRRRPAPRSVVAGIGPELTGLGPTAAGIEHRRGRLVGEELR